MANMHSLSPNGRPYQRGGSKLAVLKSLDAYPKVRTVAVVIQAVGKPLAQVVTSARLGAKAPLSF